VTVRTGLVIGLEEAWQFSILLLVGMLVIRSADGDLRRGRAWFLLGVGLVIAVWGAASLIAR